VLGAWIILVLLGNHFRPWDQAHWWKATLAVLLAWLRQVPVACLLLVLRGPARFSSIRCCSILEWTPALYLVEFWNVGMKVNPN